MSDIVFLYTEVFASYVGTNTDTDTDIDWTYLFLVSIPPNFTVNSNKKIDIKYYKTISKCQYEEISYNYTKTKDITHFNCDWYTKSHPLDADIFTSSSIYYIKENDIYELLLTSNTWELHFFFEEDNNILIPSIKKPPLFIRNANNYAPCICDVKRLDITFPDSIIFSNYANYANTLFDDRIDFEIDDGIDDRIDDRIDFGIDNAKLSFEYYKKIVTRQRIISKFLKAQQLLCLARLIFLDDTHILYNNMYDSIDVILTKFVDNIFQSPSIIRYNVIERILNE